MLIVAGATAMQAKLDVGMAMLEVTVDVASCRSLITTILCNV